MLNGCQATTPTDGRGAHGTLVRAASRLTQSWSDCLGLALPARSALPWLQASPTGGPVRSRKRFPVARPGRLAEMKRLMLGAGHADGLCRIRNVATRVNSCPTGPNWRLFRCHKTRGGRAV